MTLVNEEEYTVTQILGDNNSPPPSLAVSFTNGIWGDKPIFKLTCSAAIGGAVLQSIQYEHGHVVLDATIRVNEIKAMNLSIRCDPPEPVQLPLKAEVQTINIEGCTPRVSESSMVLGGPEINLTFKNCQLPESLAGLVIAPDHVNSLRFLKCTGLKQVFNDHRLYEVKILEIKDCPDFRNPGQNITVVHTLVLKNLQKLSIVDNTLPFQLALLHLENLKFEPEYAPRANRINEVRSLNVQGLSLDKVGTIGLDRDYEVMNFDEYDLSNLLKDKSSYCIRGTPGKTKVRGQVAWPEATRVNLENLKFLDGAKVTLGNVETLHLQMCDFGGRSVDDIFSVTSVRKLTLLENQPSAFGTNFDGKIKFLEVSYQECTNLPRVTNRLGLFYVNNYENALGRHLDANTNTYVIPCDLELANPPRAVLQDIDVQGHLAVKGFSRKQQVLLPFRTVTCGSFDISVGNDASVCTGSLKAISLDRRDACVLRLHDSSPLRNISSEENDVDIFPDFRCYRSDREIMTPRNGMQDDSFESWLLNLRLREERSLQDMEVLPTVPMDVLVGLIKFMGEYPRDSGTEESKNWIRLARAVFHSTKITDEYHI